MSIEEMINTIEETYNRYTIEVESDCRATVTVVSYEQIRSGRYEGDTLKEALESTLENSKPAPVRELEEDDDFIIDEWNYDGGKYLEVIGKQGYTLCRDIQAEDWSFAGHEKAKEGKEKYIFGKA
jgi:hypothetical protein